MNGSTQNTIQNSAFATGLGMGASTFPAVCAAFATATPLGPLVAITAVIAASTAACSYAAAGALCEAQTLISNHFAEDPSKDVAKITGEASLFITDATPEDSST